MSDIATIRSDLITKISAAINPVVELEEGQDPLPQIPVSKWAGEEAAITAERPSVSVNWFGGIAGESEEIGRATYSMDLIFHAIVQTADTDKKDGDDHAAELLETIRGALAEVEIAGIGIARPYKDPMFGGKTEMLTKIHGGAYEYTQAWKIEQAVG